eukprot:TRINITY_DN64359_c0_g1_i1.p1 TRINITY_DN64359_c0_g1~~TRINITY_DN64359_c0_g1_i1.p1  ORF type:complete len:496 (+),score=87.51 TRINITY_DN64359_c0_g1_i1:2-1489(+)
MVSQRWEVIGGADKGGILVRAGQLTSSTQLAERLATGSHVEELERVGERLRYLRISGAGPKTGWVSLSLKEKQLLKRIGDIEDANVSPTQVSGGRDQQPAVVLTEADSGPTTIDSTQEQQAQEGGLAAEAAASEAYWSDPLRREPSLDAHLLDQFLESNAGKSPEPPGEYKGGKLPVMPRTIGLPTHAALPDKAKKNFPEKARTPMIRLYCFPGAADNYMLWLEFATSAPSWCEVAVYEPRAHGFRPDEAWDTSLEERAADAFNVMRPAFETHARGGASEGAPFGFLSHGVGGQFMALLAHRLKQELAIEPLVIFANDGPPPNVTTLSDEGYQMLCENVLRFYTLFQPDTIRQYEKLGGKSNKSAEALLTKWSRGLRLFEEHARRARARGNKAVYHHFNCDLHVLVAKHSVDADQTIGLMPEERRREFESRKAVTASPPESGVNWDRDMFRQWSSWTSEDFHYHEVDTDHMTIKNSPLMQKIVFKELAGFCGMDY